jgi:hypothetical protein
MRPIKSYFILPFILLLLLCAGCSSFAGKHIQRLAQLPPTEALVFGKLRVLINGKDATPYSNLMFKQGRHAIGGEVKPLGPSDGVICAGLPAGDNYFWRLISNQSPFSKRYEYSFDPTDATLQLPEAGGVYYIGDITIDWTPVKKPSDYVAAFITGGLVGVGLMPYSSGEAVIVVSDNMAEDQKLFQERFHTDKILVPAFLQIKAVNQPERPTSH